MVMVVVVFICGGSDCMWWRSYVVVVVAIHGGDSRILYYLLYITMVNCNLRCIYMSFKMVVLQVPWFTKHKFAFSSLAQPVE